jgi:hypothetical protein
MEYILYEHVRHAYKMLTKNVYSPLTEDLIVSLIGSFGLEMLLNTSLIVPTNYPGQYVLCCEV